MKRVYYHGRITDITLDEFAKTGIPNNQIGSYSCWQFEISQANITAENGKKLAKAARLFATLENCDDQYVRLQKIDRLLGELT